MRTLVQPFTREGKPSRRGYLVALDGPVRFSLPRWPSNEDLWAVVWVRHGGGEPTQVTPVRHPTQYEADRWFLANVRGYMETGWLLDGSPFIIDRPSAPVDASAVAIEDWLVQMMLEIVNRVEVRA
jgi:hypothetical protein